MLINKSLQDFPSELENGILQHTYINYYDYHLENTKTKHFIFARFFFCARKTICIFVKLMTYFNLMLYMNEFFVQVILMVICVCDIYLQSVYSVGLTILKWRTYICENGFCGNTLYMKMNLYLMLPPIKKRFINAYICNV